MEIWEWGYVDRPWWMENFLNFFFSYMWSHTWGDHTRWSQQRRILRIKWVGWPVLWIPISLSPATSTIIQWLINKSSYGCKNGILAWAAQNELPLTKVNLAIDTARESNLSVAATTLIPWYGTILWIVSHLFGGGLITLGFSTMKRAVLCSYWSRHFFWMWIYLFCMQYFCQNICELTECLIITTIFQRILIK